MRMFGRRRVPAAVRGSLEAGERVLAWATGPGSGEAESITVAVTNRRLLAPGICEPVEWHHVARASWDEPVLEVTRLTGDDGAKDVRIVLDDPGSVPAQARERVMSTIVVQRHVALQDGLGVRLIARREPNGADVRWSLIFDRGLDSSDERIKALAAAHLRSLRESMGV